MKSCIVIAWLIVICGLVTGSQAQTLSQEEFNQQRSLWDSQQLSSYGFQYQRSCFCLPEFVREVVVRVEDNAVVSVTDIQTHLGFDVSFYPTINDMFDDLQSAIDRPAASISAEFDTLLGYPTQVFIDLDELIADEENVFSAANLSADLTLPACDPENVRSCAAPLIDTLATADIWLPLFLDYTGDNRVDSADRDFLIRNILDTSYGDSNLDGRFNSRDLVLVFQADEYEDAVGGNSTWATGDWNGDSEFDSRDFVLAFDSGGYENDGPANSHSVPEPYSRAGLLFGVACLFICRRNFTSLRTAQVTSN